jgi:hypothetical protein
MSLTVLIRDALESLPTGAPGSWSETLEFIGVRLERAIQSLVQFIFLGGWFRQVIDLPIVVPQLAEARTWLPAHGSLQFPVQEEAFSPSQLSNAFSSGFAFREGLLNGLFLGLPLTLSHVLVFKRRYIQGLPQGLTARVSYRLGETVLLCLTGRGRGTLFHQWDPLPLLFGLWLTARVIYEVVQLRRTGLQRYVPYIAGLHFTFAFVEQGVVLGTLGSQTLDTAATAARLWVGPGAWISSLSYGFGLFSSSLRIDAVFLSFALWGVEKLLLFLNVSPEFWRRRIDRATSNLIAAFALTSIPFYTADYISRNILGFEGRDSELSKLATRVAFSVEIPAEDEEDYSRIFEGRYSRDNDSYGRAAPDRVRDPVSLGDPAIENIADPVDERFISRNANQRVDVVFLRGWEEALYNWIRERLEWLTTQVGLTTSRETGGKNGESGAEEEEQPSDLSLPVVVGPSSREDLGTVLAPSVRERVDPSVRNERGDNVDAWAERRELWYRASQVSEVAGIFSANLPIARTEENHPEGLTALYQAALNPHQFLAGFVLPVEHYRPLRYESAIELGRKRRARANPLHHAVITGYRDYLLSRQPRELITTAEDQLGLYRARLALDDYLTAARSYHEAEQDAEGLTNSTSVALRGAAQRRLDWARFNGVRSRESTIFSQQYTGNLHLVRRLFVISWDPRETRIAQGVRRKLSLDQLAPQWKPAIREHEELGRAAHVGVQPDDFYEGPEQGDEPNWVILPDTVEYPDTDIHPNPLYAGWDQERRALVLTNRVLPPERAVRAGPSVGGTEDGPWTLKRAAADSALAASLKAGDVSRRNFTVWPRNDQVLRRESERNPVNSRANLSRRRPVSEPNLLAWDRAQWAKQSVLNDTSNTNFSFWRNPQSEARTGESDEPTPARSTQLFPLAFDLAFRNAFYTPGVHQPTARGGLVWPGQAREAWFSSTAWRPHGEFSEFEEEAEILRERAKRTRETHESHSCLFPLTP